MPSDEPEYVPYPITHKGTQIGSDVTDGDGRVIGTITGFENGIVSIEITDLAAQEFLNRSMAKGVSADV